MPNHDISSLWSTPVIPFPFMTGGFWHFQSEVVCLHLWNPNYHIQFTQFFGSRVQTLKVQYFITYYYLKVPTSNSTACMWTWKKWLLSLKNYPSKRGGIRDWKSTLKNWKVGRLCLWMVPSKSNKLSFVERNKCSGSISTISALIWKA